MSTKRLSPGARLFRNSRLASMPAPLKKKRGNPTLTPFPTHQAITAPTSSLTRGDWGLKRNLPSKILSDYARYDEIDNIEHRTTFESAHDAVYALKKWQEMGLNLHQTLPTGKVNVSAFQVSSATARWGYRRPYLPNLSGPELKAYIKKYILPRREAFLAFLARQQMKEARIPPPVNADPAGRDILKTGVGIASLRRNRIQLRSYVQRFLGLPTTDPMQTHPSAGLYYTLNDSHMYNNWETGIQMSKTYIGRDIGASVMNSRSIVSLGGFVGHMSTLSKPGGLSPIMTRWEPIEVEPSSARINFKGRLDFELKSNSQGRATESAKLLDRYDMSSPTQGYMPSPIPALTNNRMQAESTSSGNVMSALEVLLHHSPSQYP